MTQALDANLTILTLRAASLASWLISAKAESRQLGPGFDLEWQLFIRVIIGVISIIQVIDGVRLAEPVQWLREEESSNKIQLSLVCMRA
jgi:hypothetical protein